MKRALLSLLYWIGVRVDGDKFCGAGWLFDQQSGGCTKLAAGTTNKQSGTSGSTSKKRTTSGAWQQQTSANGRWNFHGHGAACYLLRAHVVLSHDECVCVQANGLGAALAVPRIHADGRTTAAVNVLVQPPQGAGPHTFSAHVFAPHWYSALRDGRMEAAQRCVFESGVSIAVGAAAARAQRGTSTHGLAPCMAVHGDSGAGLHASNTPAAAHTLQWRRVSPMPWLRRQLVELRSPGCRGCSGSSGSISHCRTHPAGMTLTLCTNPPLSFKKLTAAVPSQPGVACPPGYRACLPHQPTGARSAPLRRVAYSHCRFRGERAATQRFIYAEGLGQGMYVCLCLREALPGGSTAAAAVVLTPHPKWLRASPDGSLRGHPPVGFAPVHIRVTLLQETAAAGGRGAFGVHALFADITVEGLRAARSATGTSGDGFDSLDGNFPLSTPSVPSFPAAARTAPAAPTPPHGMTVAATASSTVWQETSDMIKEKATRTTAATAAAAAAAAVTTTKIISKAKHHVHGAGCQCYGRRLNTQCARCAAIANGGGAGGWAKAVRYSTEFWADRCIDREAPALKHDACPTLTLLGKSRWVLREGESFDDPGAVATAGWRLFGKDVSATVRITCGPVGQLLAPVASSALQFLLSYTAPSKAGRWSCPRVLRTVEYPALVMNRHAPGPRVQQMLSELPLAPPSPPLQEQSPSATNFASHHCTGGRTFVRCGPMCTPTCAAPNPCSTMPMCCSGDCVAKCMCEGGSVWSEAAGVCLDVADC